MMEKNKKTNRLISKPITGNPPLKSFDNYTGRPPFIFSIPRMYDDDYRRNDAWYLQLLKIERRTKDLKKEMQKINERHTSLYNQTKILIEASMQRLRRIYNEQPEEEIDNLSLN